MKEKEDLIAKVEEMKEAVTKGVNQFEQDKGEWLAQFKEI